MTDLDTPMDAEDAALQAAIGRLLGDARQAAGMSQSAAAKAIGISQSRVARLERGLRRLRFDEAAGFARLYNVALSAFDPAGRDVAEVEPLQQRRTRADARKLGLGSHQHRRSTNRGAARE